jgi:hypothetical protein
LIRRDLYEIPYLDEKLFYIPTYIITGPDLTIASNNSRYDLEIYNYNASVVVD